MPAPDAAGGEPRIAPGFRLRSVETDADVDRYVDLNQAVTREGQIARRLIEHRPGARRADFLMAEEISTGRAVSTTCLLQWRLSLEGIPLEAAMLEMVVTDPACRRHGLVRGQIHAFHDRAATLGADITIIQGIPFYYRQFGYAYALDHTPTLDLDAGRVGPPPQALLLRPAAAADAPLLAELYQVEMSRQGLWVERTADDFRYLLEHAERCIQVVEAAQPLGFLSAEADGGDRLLVAESSLRDPRDAPRLLALLASGGSGQLSICGNDSNALYRAAAACGGMARMPAQWLVRIADPAALLRRLAPLLERRLEGAGFLRLDGQVLVNLFRGAIRIDIAGGRISGIENAGFVDASPGADGGDLCIPPDAFVRLVLGYRDLDQLRDAWPDTTIRAASRPVLDALFPRFDSLVLMPY